MIFGPDNHLKQAARYADAQLEEREHLPSLVEEKLGLPWEEVWHVCEQRALRLIVNERKSFIVSLNRKDREKLVTYATLVLDGIMIGHEGTKIAERDV